MLTWDAALPCHGRAHRCIPGMPMRPQVAGLVPANFLHLQLDVCVLQRPMRCRKCMGATTVLCPACKARGKVTSNADCPSCPYLTSFVSQQASEIKPAISPVTFAACTFRLAECSRGSRCSTAALAMAPGASRAAAARAPAWQTAGCGAQTCPGHRTGSPTRQTLTAAAAAATAAAKTLLVVGQKKTPDLRLETASQLTNFHIPSWGI